jgi:Flp pilus assembly pilin Flp
VKVLFVRLHILLSRREQGQTMAEYAVVLGVITIALIAAFQLIGTGVSSTLNRVASDI